jgi:Domain of unknown function (DUF4169)
MGEIINFRIVRKKAKRKQEAEQADRNRIVHGRTKAQRGLDAARSDRAQRELDAHKIETGDGR